MISLCIKENNSKILKYLTNEIKKSSISDIYYSVHSFKIYNNLIIHYKGSSYELFYNFVSKAISNSIIKFYEPTLINKMISLNYFYFSDDEKKVIYDEYKLLIRKKNNRLKLINNSVLSYLTTNKSIILNGFVHFRLFTYTEYVDKLLQDAINQFIVDKEYYEFVDLLKNYVDSKIPEDININLIYVNSEAILLYDNGQIVNLDKFNSIYLSDISFCSNDYVLNTLIGILPCRICLHLISKEDSFIKTIKLIFSDKVVICKGCTLCDAYEMLKLK